MRDPETGKTWSGRGRKPAWLKAHEQAGRSLEEFRVAS
ncbi:H-NS family nucleoid-associated regulatory protein [Aquisalimonas sp. APHAB1-3]